MINKDSKQFYIVGYMHSGTSLLHVILKQSQEVFSTHKELKFYEYYNSIVQKYKELSDPVIKEKYIKYLFEGIGVGFLKTFTDKNDTKNLVSYSDHDVKVLLNETENLNDHGKLFVKVYDYIANGKLWFTKVASYSIEDVIKDTPNVKFINIVRDVRDVLASKKKRMESVESNEKFINKHKVEHKKLEKLFDAYLDSIGWRENVSSGMKASDKFPNRILSIRYEDLVIKPEETIKKCCDFIGIKYLDDMASVSFGNSADAKYKTQGGIVTQSKGRYKLNLEALEIATIQRACKKEMKYFNYELENTSTLINIKSYLKKILAPFHLVDRLFKRYKLTSGGTQYKQWIINYRKKFLKF